jgi:hypothetical protein
MAEKKGKGVMLVAQSQIVTGYDKAGKAQGYHKGQEFEMEADVAESLIAGGYAIAKEVLEEAAEEALKSGL